MKAESRRRNENNDLFVVTLDCCLDSASKFTLAADTEEQWNEGIAIQTEIKEIKKKYLTYGQYELCHKQLECLARKYKMLKDFYKE